MSLPASIMMQQPKVHFQPWVDFVTIPNISYYSQEEIDTTWYSPEELRRQRRRSRSDGLTSLARNIDTNTVDFLSTHEAGQLHKALHDVHGEETAAETYCLPELERVHHQPQEDRLLKLFQW